MKGYLIKALWFLLGFIIFLVVEGIAYHGLEAANRTGSIAILGVAFFVLWAFIYGIYSARKAKCNWAFIIGATIAYVLVSGSLEPILIALVIFTACHGVLNRKKVDTNLDQEEWAKK